ncbi:MAG TPA: DUF4236 domain-containing protein [Candidatus Acidoferrales bacterium]|nr:DUF4236 domain-containing protein [Candidatus Acidoferrales bacterium]
MSWRFRKTFKLLPGVRLNLTARGLSATLGASPFSINVGPRGVYRNIDIPGTGLWNRQRIVAPSITHPAAPSQPAALPDRPQPANLVSPTPPHVAPAVPQVAPEEVEIRSASTESLNSENMKEFRKLITQTYEERTALKGEIASSNGELSIAAAKYDAWERGFLLKRIFKRSFAARKEAFDTANAKTSELAEQLKLTKLSAHFDIDRQQAEPYYKMRDEFAALCECQKIWDALSRKAINRVATRSAANEAVGRTPVTLSLSSCDVLEWEQKVPHFPNCIGGDLYIYPGFVLYRASKQAFALIDFHEVKLEFQPIRFIEEEPVPSDAQKIGEAWAKSNKDGGPDLRFRDNYQIPVVAYGDLLFSSASGLNEQYEFSSPALAQRFANAWETFQRSFGSM